MADIIEVVAKFRDEASRELEKFGTSLQQVAKMGIEPISKISPTAGAALEGFLGKLGPTGLAVTALGGAAIGAVAGLTSLVKSVADTADHLKDLSQVTGASVESLSALGLAAEKSGSSLEDVAGSFKHMQKAISEAAQGSAEANAALEQLGLSAQTLKSQSPEEQFESLARSIAAVQDPTERARLAMATFGKAGVDLLPVLNTVAEQGMGAVIERGKELGIVISTQTANAADEFNDTLRDLKAVGQGLVLTLGSALLPMFVQVAKIILEAATAVSRFLRETGLLKGLATVIQVALAPVLEIIRAVAGGFIALSQILRGEFSAGLETLRKTAGQFGDSLVDAFGGSAEASGKATSKITQDAKNAEAAFLALSAKQTAASAELQTYARSAAQSRAQADAEAKNDRTALVQLELQERVAAIREEEQKRLTSLRTLGLTEAAAAEERQKIQEASLNAITAANQKAVTQWLQIERERADAVRQVEAEIRQSREETATTLASIAANMAGNAHAALEAEHQATLDAIARQREARLAAADAIIGDVRLAAQQRVAAEESALNQIAVAEARLAQERRQIVQSSSQELIGMIHNLGTSYAEELKPLQLMNVTENLNRQLSLLDAAYTSGLLSINAYVSASAQAQAAAEAETTAILYGLAPAVNASSQEFAAGSDAAATWSGTLAASTGGLSAVQASAEQATASVARLNAVMGAAVAPDLQATAEAALAASTATRPYTWTAPGTKKVYIPNTMFSHARDPRSHMFDRWNPNAPPAMPGANIVPWGETTEGTWYQFPGGGRVPGPMGQKQMAVVESGETILPTGATATGGAGLAIHIHLAGNVFVDDDQRMDRLAQAVWDRVRDRQRRLLTR